MSARRKKSLHHNLQDGENVSFHREHRSKRGRERFNRSSTPIFLKLRRDSEELSQGVDKGSLRYIRSRYRI